MPPAYRAALGELNASPDRHQLSRFLAASALRQQENPLRRQARRRRQESRSCEDENLVLRRVLGISSRARLLVINDEAHHCYLPRAKGKDTEARAESETENERAAVWFSGIRAVAQRFKLRAVYDLSATPYYLTGSGYPTPTRFPVVGLRFRPDRSHRIRPGQDSVPARVDDSSHAIDEPVLENLYEHCKGELPKKGQRKTRTAMPRTQATNPKPRRTCPASSVPPSSSSTPTTKTTNAASATKASSRPTCYPPPVFIVVCNNTTVSREVFKEIAGYEQSTKTASHRSFPAACRLFSQLRPQYRSTAGSPTDAADRQRCPRTLRPDRREFKKVFGPEIERFKRDYRRRHPRTRASNKSPMPTCCAKSSTPSASPTPSAPISVASFPSRCSPKAGTPTPSPTSWACAPSARNCSANRSPAGHCAAGTTYIDPKTGKFPPEYAHIIGVPFKLFKAGKSSQVNVPEYATLRALPERSSLEIRFPNLVGYRLETDSSELKADFTATPDYFIDTTRQPVETTLGTAVSGDTQTLRANLEALRDQQVIYKLTKEYLRRVHDEKQRDDLRLFQQVKTIVGQWYEQKLKLKGEDDPIYKRLVIYDDPQPIVESINRGIIAHAAERERVLPILNHYNPVGTTAHVFGHTSKKTWPTKKSHINLVVADTDTWEQIAAKTLEKLPAVESYVKNAFLGFAIPYVDGGKERNYLPDYLVRLRTPQAARSHPDS